MNEMYGVKWSKLLFACPFVALIMTLLLSTSVYPESVRGVTDATIKIGGILDQTGPVAGDITVPITKAFRNYIRFVNDNGGIFGRKIKFIVEDDRYSIPVGVAAFRKLVYKDKIFALFGPASTGEAKALFGQIQKLKIPNLTGAPDEVQVKPLKRYIFMPFNVYHDHLGVIFDYIINDLKQKDLKVTFIYFDAESGKVALASARKWAKFFNFHLDTEVINMGALDAASQVMSIKRKKPTHIVIHHGAPGTIALLRDMKKFNLGIPVYGTLITCIEDTVRMAGNSSKNYIGAQIVSSWHEDYPGINKMREVTLKYHPGTETANRTKMYTLGWLFASIFHEGIKRAGRDLNGESLVEAWESIQDMDTGGVAGPVGFSPTDHQGVHYTKLFRAEPKSKTLIPITGWRKTPKID